jgi:transposase
MGEEQHKHQRPRRRFTEKFKRDAVQMVHATGRSSRSPRELGIYDSTLGNWIRQDRIDRGESEGLIRKSTVSR